MPLLATVVVVSLAAGIGVNVVVFLVASGPAGYWTSGCIDIKSVAA